jgi:hypothetical protein
MMHGSEKEGILMFTAFLLGFTLTFVPFALGLGVLALWHRLKVR